MNNDNKEVLEAISALSTHVDNQINGVKEEIFGKMEKDMGKLRSDLIDHVTKAVSNSSIGTVKDSRVDRTVHKLKEKNIFSPADVLEVLTPAPQG